MQQENVRNYLKQLGFTSSIKTLEDITQLMQAHEKKFVFSSFKILLKENISLDINDIYESIVVKKRGGYCFEHNKLFFEVLKALGFKVNFYMANMKDNSASTTLKKHRFTVLEFEGEKYLIDVGIGFASPTVPVKFGDHITFGNLGICYTIQENNNQIYSLQIIKNNKVFGGTEFDLKQCKESDFQKAHLYAHKNPNAIFVNNLVISSITKTKINSLINCEYFKIYETYEEKTKIEDMEQFQNILKNDFDIMYTSDEVKILYTKFIKNMSK